MSRHIFRILTLVVILSLGLGAMAQAQTTGPAGDPLAPNSTLPAAGERNTARPPLELAPRDGAPLASAPSAAPAAPLAPNQPFEWYCAQPNATVSSSTFAYSSIDLTGQSARTIQEMVVFVNLDHTWVGDLELTIDDTTTTRYLIDNPNGGNCTGDVIFTTFDDDGLSLGNTDCLAGGTNNLGGGLDAVAYGEYFRPLNSLIVFEDGDTINKTWRLGWRDTALGDTGTLNEWCVGFITEAAPGAVNSVTTFAPTAASASVLPAFQEYFMPLREETAERNLEDTYTDAGEGVLGTLAHPLYTSGGNPIINPWNPHDVTETEFLASMVAAADGTIIVWDQWEDGYETGVSTSANWSTAQASSQVWGDGVAANGCAPKVPAVPCTDANDVIDASDVLQVQNWVPLPANPATSPNFYYDGGDRLLATAPIAVSRAGWGDANSTLHAGANEVYPTSGWGTAYTIPLGENMPGASLVPEGMNAFEVVAIEIMASQDSTSCSINLNNGAGPFSRTLNRGQAYYVSDVQIGATVSCGNAVQVTAIAGDRDDPLGWETRRFTLRPNAAWSTQYYIPVGSYRELIGSYNVCDTSANETVYKIYEHTAWVYGPSGTTVSWTPASMFGANSGTIPASGVLRVPLPIGSGMRISTASTSIFVIVTVDANNPENPYGRSPATSNATYPTHYTSYSCTTGGNPGVAYIPGDSSSYEWGFAAQPTLGTQFIVGLGFSYDPAASGFATCGSTVRATPTAATTIYVDYNNDGTADASSSAAAYQSVQIVDAGDQDMSGARVYTTDNTQMALVWGLDVSCKATTPNLQNTPYLDLGTAIPPLPSFLLGGGKESDIVTDVTPVTAPLVSAGDVIEYTIRVESDGSGDFDATVEDTIPQYTTYVASSTAYQLNCTGSWTAISDSANPTTAFPLDEGGYAIPDSNLAPGGSVCIRFQVTVNSGIPLGTLFINNTAEIRTNFAGSTQPQANDPIDQNPLAVTLAEFYAQQISDYVLVTWETVSELDNAGFNLYRSESAAGPQTLLAYLPSSSPGGTAGAAYSYEDRAGLVPGTTYFYWLEDVATSGATTLHGPVSVDYSAPTAVTLSGVAANPGPATALPWLWIVAGAGTALGASRLRRRGQAR